MRTLRLSLVGTVTLVLLAGLGAVGLAQDTSPVAVTGTVATQAVDESEEEWWAEPMTVGHARGFKVIETWEWSDPRLPADKVVVMNFDMYDMGSFRELPFTQTSLLQGPEGYWTGTSSGYFDAQGIHHGVEILTGHGAYEGLFATLHIVGDPVTDTSRAEGLIFEGEMPPMPDAVEPSAE